VLQWTAGSSPQGNGCSYTICTEMVQLNATVAPSAEWWSVQYRDTFRHKVFETERSVTSNTVKIQKLISATVHLPKLGTSVRLISGYVAFNETNFAHVFLFIIYDVYRATDATLINSFYVSVWNFYDFSQTHIDLERCMLIYRPFLFACCRQFFLL